MNRIKILFVVLLISVLLCACTTNSTLSNTSIENSSTLTDGVDNTLESFIKSKEYLNYTKLFIEQHPDAAFSYCITDLNADSTNELLLFANDVDQFGNTWLFTIYNDTVTPVFEHYGFGKFKYSPKENAVIIPPKFRPFKGASQYSFYVLNKKEFTQKFSVGEINVDRYLYWDSKSTKDITKDELSTYIADAVNFEWLKIDK